MALCPFHWVSSDSARPSHTYTSTHPYSYTISPKFECRHHVVSVVPYGNTRWPFLPRLCSPHPSPLPLPALLLLSQSRGVILCLVTSAKVCSTHRQKKGGTIHRDMLLLFITSFPQTLSDLKTCYFSIYKNNEVCVLALWKLHSHPTFLWLCTLIHKDCCCLFSYPIVKLGIIKSEAHGLPGSVNPMNNGQDMFKN